MHFTTRIKLWAWVLSVQDIIKSIKDNTDTEDKHGQRLLSWLEITDTEDNHDL
jgi:hypothetical protein